MNMAVQYDFYKNPSPKDSKKRVRYHARVVPYGTVDTNKLAQRIHSRCTVTPADVKAVLSSLSDVVIEELKDIVADIKEERKAEQSVKPVSEIPQAEPIVEAAPAKETEEKPVIAQVEETIEEVVPQKVDTEQPEQPEKTAPAVEKAAQKAVDKKAALAEAEEKGRAFLSKIFEEMDLDVTIDVKEKNGYLTFDLKGKNLGILIGRRGDTLDSLQFLLNLVINDKNGIKVKGIVDIENYRAKREETLIGLSHKLAAKARKTGQKVVLEPMNPQERRIIHMALQNDRRVSTYSEGEEPYRKVVIVPEVPVKEYRKKESKQA